jgi:GH15 family glucan-1,4-alpha-glucosidase
MQSKDFDTIIKAASKILNESKNRLSSGQIKALKSNGITNAQIKTLDSAVNDGYELVSIIDSTKYKGSLLIRDYENATFSNVYAKDLGNDDKCAIIDPSGKMIAISLKKFDELQD